MKIITTAGTLTAVQHSDIDHVLVVRGSSDSVRAMYDGICMSGGLNEGPGERPEPIEHSDGSVVVTVDKELYAVWVQFEILNYLTYTELPKEME